MSLKYFVAFSVKGSGPFPLDMLRYDRCFPSGFADVKHLGETTWRREVRLVSFSAEAKAMIHEDRWRSFGWEVVDIKVAPLNGGATQG